MGLRRAFRPIGATMFPVRPLLRSGTEEQKQRWLPRLASEQGCLAAIAFTEPGAGSDVSGIQATARSDGDAYVLSGEKCYVTNGGIAELTIVFAKLDGAITAFLVEAGESARAGRSRSSACAPRTRARSCSTAPACPPTGSGEEGEGFAIAMDFFMHSRPQVAASAVGIARAAFEYATDYANERARRQAAAREAGRLVQARGHGDAGRGRAAARLAPPPPSTRARTRACSAPTRRPSPPTSR